MFYRCVQCRQYQVGPNRVSETGSERAWHKKLQSIHDVRPMLEQAIYIHNNILKRHSSNISVEKQQVETNHADGDDTFRRLPLHMLSWFLSDIGLIFGIDTPFRATNVAQN